MTRAPTKSLPSRAELLALLDYNPETGELTWRRKPATDRSSEGFNRRAAGKPAGTVKKGRCNHLSVGIRKNGKPTYYLAHRLIWKMITGNDPVAFIDHIDGDKLNQRWDNLREATNGQNIHNAKIRVDNKSGVKGVCWDNWHQKWSAYISINGRQKKLGRFDQKEVAAKVAADARKNLHGAFARYE